MIVQKIYHLTDYRNERNFFIIFYQIYAKIISKSDVMFQDLQQFCLDKYKLKCLIIFLIKNSETQMIKYLWKKYIWKKQNKFYLTIKFILKRFVENKSRIDNLLFIIIDVEKHGRLQHTESTFQKFHHSYLSESSIFRRKTSSSKKWSPASTK